MIVLGIETSCDDTSAAIFDGQSLLSNIISTQLVHRRFGGIVPELASRSHIRLLLPIIHQAISHAKLSKHDIEGVAVTYGPGLAGSLLAGLSVAKGIACSLNVPIIGINHLEGHLWANRLEHPDLVPPFVALIASGGHTQIVLVVDWGEYKVLGRTRDDAAGEAFDKVGKLLQLGYPGGPVIEEKAKEGNSEYIRFPRAYLDEGSLDFSFSGLKTAVLNHVKSIGAQIKDNVASISACFQDAVIDVLVEKTIYAAKKTGVSQVCLAGGVAVNRVLQERMKKRCVKEKKTVIWPSRELCSDNGGMIAMAGHYYLQKNIQSTLKLSPSPSLNL